MCLNLALLEAVAQQKPISVEVAIGDPPGLQRAKELPRFQAGVEVLRPISFPLGVIRDWKQVLPLEGVVQYRLADMPLYVQLYSGYFQGSLHYQNGSVLSQTGFYMKPGLLWVIKSNGPRHSLAIEANLIGSWNVMKGENTFYGPIFGDYSAATRHPVIAYGAEAGVGTDLLRLGSYKLRVLGRMYVYTPPDPEVVYIPGVGYAGSIGIGAGLNLYLMHAW